MPVFGPGGGKDEQSDIGHVHFEVAGYKFGDHLVKCDKFSHGRRWDYSGRGESVEKSRHRVLPVFGSPVWNGLEEAAQKEKGRNTCCGSQGRAFRGGGGCCQKETLVIGWKIFGDMDVIIDFSWRCLSASVAMTRIAVGRYLFNFFFCSFSFPPPKM